MVSLTVENVGLRYPVPWRFSLARRRTTAHARGHIGGHVEIGSDGRKYVNALEDVSFSLASGDRLAIVGPNGAGKTTLLKLLYGIFKPSTGRVTREGRVDALFNINLGFRQEVSGRRNIVLRGLMNGWSRQQIEERMEEIIDFRNSTNLSTCRSAPTHRVWRPGSHSRPLPVSNLKSSSWTNGLVPATKTSRNRQADGFTPWCRVQALLCWRRTTTISSSESAIRR